MEKTSTVKFYHVKDTGETNYLFVLTDPIWIPNIGEKIMFGGERFEVSEVIFTYHSNQEDVEILVF